MDPKVMTCQESSGNLLARFRQELSPADSIPVEDHLKSCSACREEEAEISSLAGLISSLPEVEPAADSWSRMLMMIEASDAAAPAPSSAGRKRVKLLALVAVLAAAGLLLLVFLPSAPPPLTLLAGPGILSLNGAPVTPGHPIELGDGAVLEAGSMVLATLSLSRSIQLVMSDGTRVETLPDGHLRLLNGHLFVTVSGAGDPVRFYAVGNSYVEVTGTAFDLVRNGSATTATVAVAQGEVQVRTGQEPVRVIQGQSVTFGPNVAPAPEAPADPARIGDWCRTPTFLLAPDGDALRLTLRNDTVLPLKVKPFDPQKAVYSLLIEGPEIRLPVKIQERMVKRTGPTDREIRTLQPGEGYDLLLDPDALGLTRGTYRVSAVYKPYPPLPEDVWHGPPLTTEALTLSVE